MFTIGNKPNQPQKKHRIALFGLFGVSNLGNDSSLQAMLMHIRRLHPEAEVTCICSDPIGIGAKYGLPTVPIRQTAPHNSLNQRSNGFFQWPLKLFRRGADEIRQLVGILGYLRDVDTFIIPGTGILDDFGVRPLEMPYDLFKWCLLANLSGAKVHFVSIGAGPIHHPLSRWLMKNAAKAAVYRSYRDELSKQYMASIGFNTASDPVYPDLVFSLPVTGELPPTAGNMEGMVQDAPVQGNKAQVIGIGVMEYYGWRNLPEQGEELYQQYIAKLGQFVLWLLAQQYVVRILIGQAHDQRAVTDLQSYVERALIAGRPAQLIAEPITSIESLFGQIAQTDVVIATRFHNVLCSLMLNKPVISLGYAKKNDVLMAEMGLGDYCQYVEEFAVESLIEQFLTLTAAVDQVRTQLQRKTAEYRQALDEQYRLILQEAPATVRIKPIYHPTQTESVNL